ncbi:MAG: ribonuclease P protein component [Duncaniella sp.]|nr:ribonuclease P protein component [Duncaniella sp.]
MFRLGQRLYKFEKLCSETAISRLFAPNGSLNEGETGSQATLAFPLRAVWRLNPKRRIDVPQFLISVPKKRVRHAVDRVAMRRRIREAYRLNRSLLPDSLPVDIAFSYVGNTLTSYARIEKAMQKLLARIAESYVPHTPSTDSDEPPTP